MAETIYEDPERQLSISRHAVPPPGWVELLSGVVWGTGAVRYAIRDVERCVAGFAGSHFLAARQGEKLVGTYLLAPRHVHVGEFTARALYRTLLAVHPRVAGAGLGEILVREARRWMLARASGPFLTYGFVEAENVASLAVTSRSGHERWGTFVAAPFTRWRPRDDSRVEQVRPDASPVAGEADPGHVAFTATVAVPAARFALHERGVTVAAVSEIEHRWALHGLGGVSGFVARSLLPRLPGLRRYLDPDDLRFAFFGSATVAPGHDHALARVIEAVLARWRLHAGMIYLDPRGRPHAALARSGLGLVHGLGVRPRVHMVGSSSGLPPEVVAALRGWPLLLDVADHV